MRRLILLAGVGLVACATSHGPSSSASEPYWLFKADTLDDLPAPEGDHAVVGSRFRVVVPAAFAAEPPVEGESRSEARAIHRGSGTELWIRVEADVLPHATGDRIKSMLAFMNEGFGEISERRQLRVELLPPLGVASAARMDGLAVDGICWWRPGGYRLCIKVIDKHEDPVQCARLLSDLEQLLVELDHANGVP